MFRIVQSYVLLCVSFFFFQAEDGIRDLVRSRGLGDVYKRQPADRPLNNLSASSLLSALMEILLLFSFSLVRPMPVSYTHLTLPTSDLV